MFVGISNAVRISDLQQAGGLYDSIAKDMTLGFEMHCARNPRAGRNRRSAYTPDAPTVGEDRPHGRTLSRTGPGHGLRPPSGTGVRLARTREGFTDDGQ